MSVIFLCFSLYIFKLRPKETSCFCSLSCTSDTTIRRTCSGSPALLRRMRNVAQSYSRQSTDLQWCTNARVLINDCCLGVICYAAITNRYALKCTYIICVFVSICIHRYTCIFNKIRRTMSFWFFSVNIQSHLSQIIISTFVLMLECEVCKITVQQCVARIWPIVRTK